MYAFIKTNQTVTLKMCLLLYALRLLKIFLKKVKNIEYKQRKHIMHIKEDLGEENK